MTAVPARILLVEDEPKVSAFLKKGLEELSFKVEVAEDGIKGSAKALEEKYQLIILDINLPGKNGYEVCRDIRSKDVHIPILMLTALTDTDDKLKGFDCGADDYLGKPFEFRELAARIRVLLKRSSAAPEAEINVLQIADLVMDLDKQTVMRSGVDIHLTSKEFALLEYFLRNQGKVISRAEIAENVWDINFDTGTNVIDVYVNFLRKKIDKDFPKKLIHTAIGRGYILKEE